MNGLDDATVQLVRDARPVIESTLKALVPEVITGPDGKIEYHFHAPIIINIGHNAEAMVGDAAICAKVDEKQRRY